MHFSASCLKLNSLYFWEFLKTQTTLGRPVLSYLSLPYSTNSVNLIIIPVLRQIIALISFVDYLFPQFYGVNLRFS